MNTFDDDSIIKPLKTRQDRDIPSAGLFLVNTGEAAAALQAVVENGGEKRFLHNSGLSVSRDGSRFVAGPALGAPAAALVLEKLIVLGAKHIFFMGWCGSIDPDFNIGDILVPSGSVSGEGTSSYYSGKDCATVSSEVSGKIEGLLTEAGLSCKQGVVWSTDAPYRESKKYMEYLHNERQVCAVDMEFSALCSVASFRGVDFGGVMVVSDLLWGNKWRPGFRNENFRRKCEQVIDCLLHNELER